MNERRGEHRLLCADMVDLEWTDPQGSFRTETALLEDISPLGLSVQTEQRIDESSVVLVNLEGVKVRAMVRYCKWREIGYFLGLTFAPGSRWSRDKFRPRHLTDPATLPPGNSHFVV